MGARLNDAAYGHDPKLITKRHEHDNSYDFDLLETDGCGNIGNYEPEFKKG